MDVYSAQVRVATDRQMQQNPLKYFVIILTFLVLLATFAFMVLASDLIDNDLFNGGFYRESTFSTGITPAPWTASLMVVLMLYQFIWVTYALSTLCKLGNNGGYLYCYPYMKTALFFVFTLALINQVALLFALDRERIDIALALVLLLNIALFVCLCFSIRGLHRHGLELYKIGMCENIKLGRGLIQNGIALYTTRITVMTASILARVLEEKAGATRETAGIIGLSVITALFLLHITIDWCVLETHFRYIFSPYIVLVFMLAGILSGNGTYDPWDIITIFTLSLLAFSILATLIKIAVSASRISSVEDPVLLGNVCSAKTGAIQAEDNQVFIGLGETLAMPTKLTTQRQYVAQPLVAQPLAGQSVSTIYQTDGMPSMGSNTMVLAANPQTALQTTGPYGFM